MFSRPRTTINKNKTSMWSAVNIINKFKKIGTPSKNKRTGWLVGNTRWVWRKRRMIIYKSRHSLVKDKKKREGWKERTNDWRGSIGNVIHYTLMKWRRRAKKEISSPRLDGRTFPPDRHDVADESGDHGSPERRRRQPSRWTGSMHGRLLVTYSRRKQQNIVNSRSPVSSF